MRLLIVLLGCFGCAVYAEPGMNPEMYSVLKPGPIHHPTELVEPTPQLQRCTVACRANVVEQPASPAELEHARNELRAQSAQR